MSSLRFGLGPVFAYEWLRASRRWQLYASRSVFIGLVLLGLCFTWGSWSSRDVDFGSAELAALGQVIYATIVTIELTMILFAAPAATAGAVCLDKARGSLVQVMATDLTDSEIVLGKLAVGLVPVVGLVFSVLPVLMLASLLGGIDPMLLLASFLVTLATAVLVCTLAFTLSVWGKKTHEVLGATYLLLLAWLALIPFLGAVLVQWLGLGWWLPWPEILRASNPYVLMYPDFDAPVAEHLWPVSIYAATCLGLSAMMVVACILTIRPATLKQRAEGGRAARRRLLPRLPRLLPTPSLDANPVLWREWTRSRPTRWGRFVGGCYTLFAIVFTAMAVSESAGLPRFIGEMNLFANVYIVPVGLLLMSVRASTSLTEERVRGSLDVLLTTPLTTPEILAGKWWGTLRTAWPMLLLPALIALAPCFHSGRWPHLAAYLGLIASYAALTTSVGLAVAVWVARQGRAVGLCVALYIAACIGWPIFTIFASGPHARHSLIFLLGSPIAGALMGSSSLITPDASEWPVQALIYNSIWCVLQFGAAILLFRLACVSFDDQLGRTADLAAHVIPWRYTRALIPFLPAEPDEPSPGPDGPSFSES